MKIQKLSERGIVFTFMDLSSPDYYCPTNIYAINGDKHIFLCDTYLGPEIMEKVVAHLEKEFGKKPFVIFNSHKHWDHHWGNCYFDDAVILSHKLTVGLIEKDGEEELKLNAKYLKGKVVIKLPNKTFEKECTEYSKEKVTFFHSPGHTEDSSSCYDSESKVLFVSDNVEVPIPYITSSDLSVYIATLKNYLEYPAEFIIPGHGDVSDKNLIEANLHYLESFPEINDDIYAKENERSFHLVHMTNLSTVAKEYYDKADYTNARKFYKIILSLNNEMTILREESQKILGTRLKEIEEKLK
ncbi:MAG: MBL fold metallo-hydrolase [Candidatus Heimdallarchaeota archaeon]